MSRALPVARVAAILALLPLLPLTGCSTRPASAASLAGPDVPVQSFDVPRLDGKGLDSVARHHGKLLLVDMWAVWCPACREELPVFEKLAKSDPALTVIAVDEGEDRATVASMVKKLGLTFPVLLDKDQAYGGVYATIGLPTAIVVRPNGTVATVVSGSEDLATWRSFLAKIRRSLNAKPAR